MEESFEIAKKIKNRFTLLNALYDITKGNLSAWCDLKQLAENNGITGSNFTQAYQWLLHEKYIKGHSVGFTFSITHIGINVIESSLLKPQMDAQQQPIYVTERKTEQHQHFYAPVTNSNIAQSLDSKNSKIEQTINIPTQTPKPKKKTILLILKILGVVFGVVLTVIKIYVELHKTK